jgi:hypothetical protein
VLNLTCEKMIPGRIAKLFAYLVMLIILFNGCKTAEITYLGVITTRYPHAPKKEASTGTGESNADTIIYARAVIELLGDKINDSTSSQKNTETSYFDTLYPSKYELLIRNTSIIIKNASDNSKIIVNSTDSTIIKDKIVNGAETTNITIQGYVYMGDLKTPSQNNFIILSAIPRKMSTYTSSSGFFEFKNINCSDLSLQVFDKYSWSFVVIPLRLRNLSTLNQITILLTAR